MPVTFVRPPGYPKINDELAGDSVLVDKLTSQDATSISDFRAALPAAGSTHSDLAGVFLVKRNIAGDGRKGTWYEADLTYESNAGIVGQPGGYRTDGEEQYSLEDGGLEKPLETKDTYRTRWNYHLAAVTTAAVPTFGTTATDLIIPQPYDTAFRWIRDSNELPAEADGRRWIIIQNKAKPGVESWIQPAPVINWKKFFYSTANARAFVAANTVGMRKTPTETFGLSGGNFLVMSVAVEPDGRYWTGVVKFQYAASGWDTDLYPAHP